ncbi:DUF1036 domain-containing protein [Shimia sp.]|uniref:DUF1036 domain-containing protein n=1 Tax=Shimia sp. TaxID=1954381 RepID=UPI0032985D3B
MKLIQFLGLCLVLAFGAGGARAGLEVCNGTDFKQSVAIAYKDGETYTSEGWWTLGPGACKTPVKGDLKRRYYYVYASASGREFSPKDKYTFCTVSEVFTIVGDDACNARGYDRKGFARVDTGKTAKEFTVMLNGSEFQAKAAPQVPAHEQMGAIARDMLPLRVAAEPGYYGEPYSQNGIFQGCKSGDSGAWCAFHAEGWKFYAYYGAGTPISLLDKLEFLPVGTPVSFAGDMMSYGDISAEVTLREVAYFPGYDRHQAKRIAMQGMWRNVDDPDSELYIEGSELLDIYGGERMGWLYLQIRERCDNGPDIGPVLIQTEPENGESYCYVIEDASDDRLELLYLGDPTPLVYRR